jgi:preprotein translocase subunit YajC
LPGFPKLLYTPELGRRESGDTPIARDQSAAGYTPHRKDAPVQGNTELTALVHVVAAQKSNPLTALLPLILIVVVFYFLLIRPQRRRQQQQARMQAQVRPGQRVMTTAGLIATVVAVEDDAVVLEIAPGVEARFVKQSIGQVLDDVDDDEETEDDAAEEAEEAPRDEEESDQNRPEDETLKDGDAKTGKKPSA